MALTPEQQAQIEFQTALETARNANQLLAEEKRAQVEMQRTRLEAVRLAKETLIENARSKPVDTREVTAADITAFAAALEAYVNA
jgi:hypothetical protein